MTIRDVVNTLRLLEMIVLLDDGHYCIRCNIPALKEYSAKMEAKGYQTADATKLQWDPSLFKRLASA